MDIRISKESRVPLHEQISGQLVFLIATKKLKPGEVLPSIKTLARTLNVHHNTVSEAMQYLVTWNLIVRRRGARLVVNDPAATIAADSNDLGSLVDSLVRTAHAQGFRDQEILAAVRERLMQKPPDHVLALSYDEGMRKLLESELSAFVDRPVHSCSPDELVARPEMAVGALVVSPPGVLPRIAACLPKTRPPIPILYSEAAPYLDLVRKLDRPAMVVLASISEAFLEISRGVLGPVASARHTVLEIKVSESKRWDPPAADIMFCDTLTAQLFPSKLKASGRVHAYPLLSSACLSEIAAQLQPRSL